MLAFVSESGFFQLQSSQPRLRLRIRPAAESRVRGGHPWIFAESIREQNREGTAGETAAVYDRNDKLLALGLYDPASPIRLRVLHRGKPARLDYEWWKQRFQAALTLRGRLRDENTTGLRLINGENDGWPGLVLDQYASTLVVKLYTTAWLPHLNALSALAQEALDPERLVLRLSRNISNAAHALIGRRDGETLVGTRPEGPILFRESGLTFEADVLRGQKTGFFLDQRENRRRAEQLAGGRDVLNAFSFTGGFSVYAARGGAVSITDLDISEHALTGAKRNFQLNQTTPAVRRARHDCIQANAFDWLPESGKPRFGLIILDPPSLAKREAERKGAVQAYEHLASVAMKSLRKGGILVSCSCSAHVSETEFFQTVRHGVARAKRRFEEIERTGHAADHPANFPEANYLKAIYLRIE
ncbi:MAG TPA: class I SAM-dependent methyltransferase [Verrucomicrobiae bacterium]|nr:class I SAM-dependent methyltransferase [Verrucomicrobiae bacterium]